MIGEFAFSRCNSLQSIVIPESVTIIGEHAFYGCKSLRSVQVLNNETRIAKSAFRECESLEGTSDVTHHDEDEDEDEDEDVFPVPEHEITYEESYMGDQIEWLFMDALDEAGVESEPSIQGGAGSDFLTDSEGNFVQVDYQDE